MIRPTTAEELLKLMEEYEQNQAAELNEGPPPATYETLSKGEKNAVFYITEDLDVSQDEAVKAVAALGEDDANNIGKLNLC